MKEINIRWFTPEEKLPEDGQRVMIVHAFGVSEAVYCLHDPGNRQIIFSEGGAFILRSDYKSIVPGVIYWAYSLSRKDFELE